MAICSGTKGLKCLTQKFARTSLLPNLPAAQHGSVTPEFIFPLSESINKGTAFARAFWRLDKVFRVL